jgi:segregation and condensation protein B
MADTLTNETLKALIEAILYVSPEPVTLDMLGKAFPGEAKDRIKGTLFELMNDYAWPYHGIQIRPVANGWKFSSKAEHHEVLRSFVKSLKAPIRLSKPSLEVLAVIAYRQPVTVPEVNEIRGVDCGGVIHTLLERKLIVTAGRKNVVGRPILYKTSREFMLQFGLRDLGELPSLREFEEMARQALGSELLPSDAFLPESEAADTSASESDDGFGTETSVEPSEATGEGSPADEEPAGAGDDDEAGSESVVSDNGATESSIEGEPVQTAAASGSSDGGEAPSPGENKLESPGADEPEGSSGAAEESGRV